MTDWQRRIGVGGRLDAIIRTAPTRDRIIVADEGPRQGRTAAIATDHKSGREDARVITDTVRQKARMPLCRRCRHRARTDLLFLRSIRLPATSAELGMWLTTMACVVCGDACDTDPLNRKDVA